MSTEARRPPTDDGLLRIGLIGRAGSGKSTVAAALAAAGAVVIDADAIGHAVTGSDPEVRAALESEYGADVYRPDGTLDRARVAARVFRDPEARARLDRLVHPRIVRDIQARLTELRERGFRGAVVIDAALLLDWGVERECDAVIAVVAAEPLRIARLAAARGWSEDEAQRRLAVQRPDAAFEAAADITLDNVGSREELGQSAGAALERLERENAARLAAGRDAC